MTTTTITTVEAASAGEDRPASRFSEPARRLLDAADELFYAQGVAATSVREITSACGLTPGALYNHFTSKDELVYTLVRHRHIRLEEDVERAQSAVAGDPVAELAAIVGVYIRMHVGGQRGAEVANREYRHLPEARRNEIVVIRRRMRDRMVAVLTEGARHGIFEIVGSPNPGAVRITAATILDMCIHSSQWLRQDGPLGIDELEEQFTAMALRLAGHPGTPGRRKGNA